MNEVERPGHGHSRAVNGSGTPTYRSWIAMKTRCTNPRQIGWSQYGGRGIKVCPEWLTSFEAFLADMGERPKGMTLDRVNPNGDYESSNCRWATSSEQARNRRPPTRQTHCHRNHPLSGDNVRWIGTFRVCKACKKINQQAAKARAAAGPAVVMAGSTVSATAPEPRWQADLGWSGPQPLLSEIQS